MTDQEIDADIERMLTIYHNRKRYNWDYYDKDHGHRPAEWRPPSHHRAVAATKNSRQRAKRHAMASS